MAMAAHCSEVVQPLYLISSDIASIILNTFLPTSNPVQNTTFSFSTNQRPINDSLSHIKQKIKQKVIKYTHDHIENYHSNQDDINDLKNKIQTQQTIIQQLKQNNDSLIRINKLLNQRAQRVLKPTALFTKSEILYIAKEPTSQIDSQTDYTSKGQPNINKSYLPRISDNLQGDQITAFRTAQLLINDNMEDLKASFKLEQNQHRIEKSISAADYSKILQFLDVAQNSQTISFGI